MKVKVVIAYLISIYNMKGVDIIEEGYRPPGICYLHRISHSRNAQTMIRKWAVLGVEGEM
jgi:hypothetical protein